MFYFSRDAEAALIELHFLIRYFAESKLFSTTSISSPYGFSSVLCNVGGGGVGLRSLENMKISFKQKT